MKFRTEQALKTIPNLKYTVLRPAVIYGTGDKIGISKYIALRKWIYENFKFSELTLLEPQKLIVVSKNGLY